MKDSLIQIYLFTYELGRSTKKILNTDENPLLICMICSTACIYLDSEACHPGRRLIRKCVWGASWFPLPFSFKQRCSAMVSEQMCSRQGWYYRFNWNKRCSRRIISPRSRPQLYCDQRLHQLIIAFNYICSAAKSFQFRQKFLIDFMKGLIECLPFANKQSKVNLLKWHNQLQQFVAICVVKAILDSILGISSSINQWTKIRISLSISKQPAKPDMICGLVV